MVILNTRNNTVNLILSLSIVSVLAACSSSDSDDSPSGNAVNAVGLALAEANDLIDGYWIGNNTTPDDRCVVEFSFDGSDFSRIGGNRIRHGSYTLESFDAERYRLNMQDSSDSGDSPECIQTVLNAPGIDYSYVVEFTGDTIMELSTISNPDVIIGEFGRAGS